MAYNKETDMWEGFIYKIWNDVNDKIYIGQTITTIEQRFSSHKSCCKNLKYKNHIYNAMRLIGVEHFYIKEECKVKNKSKEIMRKNLDIMEKNYIQKYKNLNIILYNMTDGGDHIDDGYFNKPIIQYSLDGSIVRKYNSIAEAAIENNISYSTISGCCNKSHFTSIGYIWRFQNDLLTLDDLKTINSHNNGFRIKKNIDQYSLDGNFIRTYNSISEASKDNNINCGDICACCKNKIRFAGNYIWRYSGDDISTCSFFNKKTREESLKEFNKSKRKPIEQRDKTTGELLNEFESMKQGAIAVGKNNASPISHCCLHITTTAYGYHWCYKDSYDPYFLHNKEVNTQL